MKRFSLIQLMRLPRAVLAAFALTPALVTAQSSCVSADDLARSLRLAKQYEAQYQQMGQELLETFQRQSSASAAVRQCQAESSVLTDLADTLTLSTPRCDEPVAQYNALVEKANSLKSMMEIWRGAADISAHSYRYNLEHTCP